MGISAALKTSITHPHCDVEAENAVNFGRTNKKSDVTQPSISDGLDLSNFRDRRVPIFWLSELSGAVSSIIWLIVATPLSKMPAALRKPPALDVSGNKFASKQAHENPSSYGLFIDVWFSLSLSAVLDAFAVVPTFNRPLIRQFHYAVSQRMVFLAFMLSYAVLQWSSGEVTFLSRHPVECAILSVALYIILGDVLDAFEPRGSATGRSYRGGSLHQYSQGLGRSKMLWWHALFLALFIVGVGLCLTAVIPPLWSALLPIGHIFFESVFLSMMKLNKTPRYLVPCSPPFFATVCLYWGVAPLATWPHLSLAPSAFIALVLLGRLLSDVQVRITLRHRPGVQWARKEVVISTRTLLELFMGVLILEYLGVKAITYIKPIVVLASFGLATVGFLAIPAYDIAMKIPTGDPSRCS